MGAKRANPKQIEKFRRDLDHLIKVKKYLSSTIAARIGVDPTNLSSYRSGTKNPGSQIIKKFCVEFGNETEKTPYDHTAEPSSEAKEAQVAYMSRDYRDELIDTLKDNDQFLKGEVRSINKTHLLNAQSEHKKSGTLQKIANTNESLVKQQREMNKGILQLIKTNNNLVQKVGRGGK